LKATMNKGTNTNLVTDELVEFEEKLVDGKLNY
jgi:hypothetical protein